MHRGYKFDNSQEKINQLMYIDDIKMFTKEEKEVGSLIQTMRIYRLDIGNYIGEIPSTSLQKNKHVLDSLI